MSSSRFFIFAICIFGLQAAKITKLENSILEDDADSGNCPDGFTGVVPHPTFCQFYYLCADGTPNLRECPPGLYFNPTADSCDFPESVPECVGGTWPPSSATTTPTTTTTSTPSTTTPEHPETEGTVHTGPTAQPTTTRPTTTTSPPGDITCPADPSTIFMPYPGDCERYYQCENGSVVGVFTCQSNLWFRFSNQYCMTPWGGNCT